MDRQQHVEFIFQQGADRLTLPLLTRRMRGRHFLDVSKLHGCAVSLAITIMRMSSFLLSHEKKMNMLHKSIVCHLRSFGVGP